MSNNLIALVAVTIVTAVTRSDALAQADLPHCFTRPALFDWQALDDGNVIIWTAPSQEMFEVALAHKIEGFAANDDASLEFVDSDHDGYICSEGSDSLVVWSPGDGEDGGVVEPVGEAEVYFVDRLNALALAERLNEYAPTRGPKHFGRVAH